MTPGTYNFEPHTEGDTSESVAFTIDLPTIDGTALSLSGCTITAKFRDEKSRKTALTISTGDGITITNAGAGQFKVNTGALTDLPCGNYVYDMEFQFSNGMVFTYLEGKKVVTADITRA